MIKLLGTRILLEPISVEEKTASGIILGESQTRIKDRAKVVAIGDKVLNVEIDKEVMFETNRVRPFSYEGVDYYLTDEDFIIGIF